MPKKSTQPIFAWRRDRGLTSTIVAAHKRWDAEQLTDTHSWAFTCDFKLVKRKMLTQGVGDDVGIWDSDDGGPWTRRE